MNLNFWIIQTFNGISYGALLFLLGSGLSLIFGVMRIVNLSHGSYFLLGGYVALTVIWTTGSWCLAIPVAALTIALVGLVMERLFLRRAGSNSSGTRSLRSVWPCSSASRSAAGDRSLTVNWMQFIAVTAAVAAVALYFVLNRFPSSRSKPIRCGRCC